jgi:DNA ligase-1
MKRFSHVCQRLESVPFNRSKAVILAEYLKVAPTEDATWALYLLLGGQLERAVAPTQLESWILEESALPGWLWKQCREQAGDFAETVALVAELSRGTRPLMDELMDQMSLRTWIETQLQPLGRQNESARRATLLRWWRGLSLDTSWAAHALALGRFPVHVSRRVVDDALELSGCRLSSAELTARLDALPKGLVRAASLQLDLFTGAPAATRPLERE